MNYGLIPVSVCETLCRESGNWGKTVVGSGSLPFFDYQYVLYHRLLVFFQVITNINLLLFSSL